MGVVEEIVLCSDAVDQARPDGDVKENKVQWCLAGAASHRLLLNGDDYRWREARDQGVVSAPGGKHRRRRHPSCHLSDGLQELGDPSGAANGMVPRHPDGKAAAGELCDLH
jgi:hypothetical protein